MNGTEDELLMASDTPDVEALVDEFNRSSAFWSDRDINRNDEVRFVRWDHQSPDGRKWDENYPHGKRAFPWNGASDTRIYLADGLINDACDVQVMALMRAHLQVSGVEVNDVTKAGAASKLLSFMRSKRMRMMLMRESGLLAQYQEQFGWAALHVGWEQNYTWRPATWSMEQIEATAQQQGGTLAELPDMIRDRDRETIAADLIQSLFPGSRKADIRKAIRDLRNDGKAVVPRAFLTVNRPYICALQPWHDFIVPNETTDLQRSRVIFRRDWLSMVELVAKIQDNGWNEDFVEEAKKTAGHESVINRGEISGDLLTSSVDTKENLIEIVYCYARQIKDGVPGIYCTVISPHMTTVEGEPMYGKHELVDYWHNEYPFIEFRRERPRRRVNESRGIPDLVGTQQNEIKTQRDSIFDATSFETLPPLTFNKRLGEVPRISPAAPLPVNTAGDYQFLEPPARQPKTAFDLIASVDKEVAGYFGRPHMEIPPQYTALKAQCKVEAWLTSWSQAFSHILVMSAQYMDPREIFRITGSRVALDRQTVEYDIVLSFDVREVLDPEFVQSKLQTIAQFVIPQDVAGVLDRAKLVQRLTAAISPDIAEELIVDQASASQKMFQDVRDEIVAMQQGHEPQYVQNDPTAKAKLNFAQRIASANRRVQDQVQNDPLFAKLWENYVGNLQMSVMQEQNKTIGRIGVQPVGMQNNGS